MGSVAVFAPALPGAACQPGTPRSCRRTPGWRVGLGRGDDVPSFRFPRPLTEPRRAPSTQRALHVASDRTIHESARSSPTAGHTSGEGCAPLAAQIRQVQDRFGLEGLCDAGSSRTPLRHACRTRTVWQYQHPRRLSGLLPPSPGTSRIRPSSASPPTCHRAAAVVSHLRPNRQRLTAHRVVAETEVAGQLGQPLPGRMRGHPEDPYPAGGVATGAPPHAPRSRVSHQSDRLGPPASRACPATVLGSSSAATSGPSIRLWDL